MDELGQILREAREAKSLTLTEVQEETRIGARFLEALESGEYTVLPTPVHVRGFLRNYARFLGLDPQPLLERYEHARGHEAPAVSLSSRETRAETLLPQREDQPFFDPVNMDVDNGATRNSESILRLVIIAALIVALVLVGNRFIPLLVGNPDGTQAITDGISQFVEELSGGATPEPNLDSSSSPDIGPSEVITSTSRNNFETISSTPFPTRPPLPATMETIRLKLEIVERAWLEVTIDGDIVFTGQARRGDPAYEWTALEEAKVRTGNAFGVVVTINDIQLGRLGSGRSEVKEEVWRTTN